MKDYPLTIPLGPGAEFDLVRRFAKLWGARATALGDDAAVLPLAPGMHLLVSTDTSVEDVHFTRAWLTPHEIGWRATAAALSDLAAMAAQPLGVLTALTLPDEWLPAADEIAAGIGDAAESAGTRIVGGDLTTGERLSICATVLGSAATPLTRAGAHVGDRIYLTGHLGGTGAALEAWNNRRAPAPDHRERFARPRPRIREARWLAEHGASAGIDISDGLAADVWHMAAASGVVIEMDLNFIPLARDVGVLDAAASGEEYEVVVSSPREFDTAAFRAEFGIELSEIGRVVGLDESGDILLRTGEIRVQVPRGHDHFAR